LHDLRHFRNPAFVAMNHGYQQINGRRAMSRRMVI